MQRLLVEITGVPSSRPDLTGLIGLRGIIYEGSPVLANVIRLSPEARRVAYWAGGYVRCDGIRIDVLGPTEFDVFESAPL